jgi:hypothetical protein
MASRIRIRRGTSTQWTESNAVLLTGELGIDTTLNKLKIGNGSSTWANLPFLHSSPTDLTTQATSTLSSANSYTDTAVASLGNTSSLTYVPLSDVGQADGVASLDSNGKIPDSEIPAGIARDTEIPSSTTFVPEGTSLYFTDERAQDAVGNSVGSGLSYNDTTGSISVDTSIIASKSYADQTANTAAATAVTNLIDSAPTALNTLNELAAAINDDQSFAATITSQLGTKLDTTTAVSDYLTIATASSTYLTSANATSNYLQKTQPALDYQIFNSGTGAYIVNGVLNGPITLTPNKPARISIQASGHPFWFQTSYGAYTEANVYETGIEGSGTATGQIVILLPSNAPQLYYVCQFHSTMKGVVLIEPSSMLSSSVVKTGSYTPVLKDMGTIIEMSGGGTLTITDTGDAIPVGTTYEVLQTGTSQVTIAGDGFTPNATPGLKLRTQWSSATIIKRATNSWVVLGDLSA